MPKLMPSAEYLRECFDYEPGTGILRWRVRPESHFLTVAGAKAFNKRWPGKIVGSRDKDGSLQVEICHEPHIVSRVIWKLVTGGDPVETVDHRNRVRDDNRWDNLRLASRSEQIWNCVRPNSTGFPGVSKHGNKWRARLTVNGKVKVLSGYQTPEEAFEARNAVAKKYYVEFYCGDRK